MAAVLQPADRVAIENLLTALCRAVDARAPDRLAELVTEDVVFDVGQGSLSGRDNVVAAFRGRATDTSYEARHTWSNLIIERFDDAEATLLSVFTTFAHLGSGDAMTPVWRCGDSHDVVRRGDDGVWRLSARKLNVIMP